MPQEVLDGLDVSARMSMWTRIMDWLRANPARGAVLIAAAADQIIGFASVGPARDTDSDASRTGELAAIYLLPDAWGIGAGRALMEVAISRLNEYGYADATLWVLDSNERARRFYAAAGWTPDGTTMVDDRDGYSLSEVRYRRALS
jgi:GNAT superfamily N-acetyltransferase